MRKILALVLVLLCVLCACRRAKSTADVPTVLSHAYTVSVAPFTQPTTVSDLITGNLPDSQGLIPDEALLTLDDVFRAVLADSPGKRSFTYLTDIPRSNSVHVAAQPQALSRWVAYGKAHRADLLLVPQVLDWHERKGSKAGVTESAQVRLAFYLIKVNAGTIQARSVFEEKQQALTENLLNIGTFIKRKGAWITATDLATEGMYKAKKEFGL